MTLAPVRATFPGVGTVELTRAAGGRWELRVDVAATVGDYATALEAFRRACAFAEGVPGSPVPFGPASPRSLRATFD